MENYCVIDFETRSATSIKKGLKHYFSDPHFEVLCGAFQFKGKAPIGFYGKETKKMCHNLLNFMKRHPLLAFNTGFDAGVFAKLTGIDYFEAFKHFLPVELLVKYVGGPDDLALSTNFLKLSEKKDIEGKYVVKVMCEPIHDKTPDKNHWQNHTNKNGFVEHPALFKKLLKYCKQDTIVTTKIFEKVSHYIPEMKKAGIFEDNFLNLLRNTQGIRFRIPKVEALDKISDMLKVKIADKAKNLVGSQTFNINSSQQILRVFKDFNLENSQAQSLKPIYSKVSGNLKHLIELRLNRPSIASAYLPAVIKHADSEGIVRNSFRFWGAGQTGRFSSYGVNPLAWPRSQELRESTAMLRDKKTLYTENLAKGFTAVKNIMRSCILPHKGCIFFGGDFSQIEFKLLMLCCGDRKRLKMLYQGWDAYKFLAGQVFNKTIDRVSKDERYIAKRVTLALGYGMGVKKAQNILWAEGLFVSEKLVRSVFKAYRDNFPRVSWFGYKLEESFNGKYLTVPFSRRKIHLFDCARVQGEYGPFWTYRSATKGNIALPKHKMVGWIIQSLACDIFRSALRNIYTEFGLVTDIPFHDEVVCSVPLRDGKPTVNFDQFKKVLGQSPDFIEKHLPYIQTETWKGGFYGK